MSFYSQHKFKILFTFAGMLTYFFMASFTWESNVTQPIHLPSRATSHINISSSAMDSLNQGRDVRTKLNGNTTRSNISKEEVKKASSGPIVKKYVAGRGVKSRKRSDIVADHLRQAKLTRRKFVAGQAKFPRTAPNVEVGQTNLTKLSMDFQESRLYFERMMAENKERGIRVPVNYTRWNIPKDLRELAPRLFDRFPREYLPDYKSPCWRISNNTNSRPRCLPYFFIGGFPKCATTDLWGKLMTHPSMVKTTKEPHWWTRTHFEGKMIDNYIRRYDTLVKEMSSKHRKDLITCDASALTFQDNKALKARLPSNFGGELKYVTADFIRAVIPDLKFVGIMRDPTARLYSAYLYFEESKKARKSPEDFHVRVVKAMKDFYNCVKKNDLHFCTYSQVIPHINTGCYSLFIREYLARFPRDQFYFVRTEDWSKYPARYMKDIFSFLEIDPMSEAFRQKVTKAGNLNRRKVRDRALGPMLPMTRQLLDEFYRPCNEDLAKLLNDENYLWHIKT
ncbi:carbohydrate sulfotransferase 15-like isoform X2 [Lytechinus variegatus]|nr:carbohydrate sulfotransferase 15-like isoform X2 [Lytechinus variegatus]XP_041485503.1 carbohydrate sulfotransferase 15-like isoform X2 [Lytechinus variegatus]XP_041485504.1 carbohydrate sulfotransferase 15-like isoform X2 [Lytechinus variegatus]XP_041485505.1 carbohydrate sulfotransferase 15-like isoform X2 [Lytechinus variegatus]XP_041485506.1 carbohydrate sulfotransferase 15-like isoform X2 [Lytechinus variegatus]XP_041485507.1 carbohydrate sulfotransferase 15-like isoform X2 [Lytechinus